MWDLIISVPDHCLSFYYAFLTLDGVASCLFVINIRNTCKRLRYSQIFGGTSSVQWRKVGRI